MFRPLRLYIFLWEFGAKSSIKYTHSLLYFYYFFLGNKAFKVLIVTHLNLLIIEKYHQ